MEEEVVEIVRGGRNWMLKAVVRTLDCILKTI